MINDDYADAAMEAEFAEDEDIRRAALGFISDAWAEAIANGVDADAVAHAAMFTALADLDGLPHQPGALEASGGEGVQISQSQRFQLFVHFNRSLELTPIREL